MHIGHIGLFQDSQCSVAQGVGDFGIPFGYDEPNPE
jgi:hypothetical protein